MVELINSWAQKIVIVVIICTILEMILPSGKNKKYIKMVIGIYVVFTIISPIVSKINYNSLNLCELLEVDEKQTMETSMTIDNNEYIEDVYKEKLKSDIKTKIEAINYSVQKIDLEIETEDEQTYGTILKIGLTIFERQKEKQNNINIKKIVIGEGDKEEASISEKEEENIKKYLAEIYYIDEKNIVIY